jgi:hypothetical protein
MMPSSWDTASLSFQDSPGVFYYIVFSHFIPLQSAGCAIQSESKFYYSAALPNVQIYEKADALQNGKHRLYAGFYLLQYSFPTQPEQLPLQQEPFLRFLWIFRTAHIA